MNMTTQPIAVKVTSIPKTGIAKEIGIMSRENLWDAATIAVDSEGVGSL